jgi:hypothetical protein
MQWETSQRGRTTACRIVLALAFALVIQLPGHAQSNPPAGQSQPEQKPGDQQTNSSSESGQAPAQQTPAQQPQDASTEQKNEPDANPVQQVEDKTKQAVDMTKDAATAGLLKARDWESGLIAGVYVGRNRKLVTLTAEQRKQIYLKQTLTTPGAYGKRAFGALIDQARGVPYQWDDGWGGYFERWASRQGQFITANSLAALGNAKLGYEVRYDQCKCHGLWPRTRHAFIRNLLTYDRSEESLRPQWALYGGAFAGGLVATSWKPRSQSALANGGYAVMGQLGYGTLLNFVTEFSREINRKQGVK